jgi:anti-sigma regulatory factor (Ser/Thr protein kinase)
MTGDISADHHVAIRPEAPRIAVYSDPHAAPEVVAVGDLPVSEDGWTQLARVLATRAHDLARHRGGQIPFAVFQELVDNLVHASFTGVVVTILDNGNTLRISDSGPGIPDKEAALRPGFTSADADARRSIRGVGSGFSIVTEILAGLDGHLQIEDNLGRGTVITARVRPKADIPLAPTPFPTYNLTDRQLRTLLLTVELAPVGPTRVAQELGVSTSTAFRDLATLEQAGYVVSGEGGHRTVTDSGLAYLNAVLQTAIPGI